MEKNYWKRAFVELAIIVAGVLIALWVEQWREGLVDRRLERSYLESLATDLRADLAEFNTASAWTMRHQHSARLVLEFISGSAAPHPDSLIVAVGIAGWQYPPTFSTHTIDDLRSTGNLRVLRNKDLKRAISDYYRALHLHDRLMEPLVENIWTDYDAKVRHLLTPEERVRVLKIVIGPQPVQDNFFDSLTVSPETIRAKLLQRSELSSALDEVIFVASNQRGYLGELGQIAKTLLAQVETELE